MRDGKQGAAGGEQSETSPKSRRVARRAEAGVNYSGSLIMLLSRFSAGVRFLSSRLCLMFRMEMRD